MILAMDIGSAVVSCADTGRNDLRIANGLRKRIQVPACSNKKVAVGTSETVAAPHNRELIPPERPSAIGTILLKKSEGQITTRSVVR